jgi:uncharacterized protein (DUF2147 family)
MKKAFSILAFLIFYCNIAFSQTDQLERNLWYNAEKTSKVQIYKAADGKFYGRVVWLKVTEENGKLRTDKNNPDEKKRNVPLMGLVVLRGLEKDGKTEYEDGTIYDPKNGKTYSCKIKYYDDHLDLRGYVGISLIGRTATWTKAD